MKPFLIIFSIFLLTKSIDANSTFTYEEKISLNSNTYQYINPKVVLEESTVYLWATGGVFNDGTLPSSAFARHISGVCIGLNGVGSRFVKMNVLEISDLKTFGAIVENIENTTAVIRYIARFDQHPYWPPINLSQNFPIFSITCR